MKVSKKQWLAVPLLGLAIGAGATIATRRYVSTPGAEANKDCLQSAQDFMEYPLIFAGTEFRGLPLSGCQRYVTPEKHNLDGSVREPAMDFFGFTYGSCAPVGDEGGCPPPVQILVDPPCAPAISGDVIREQVEVRGVWTAVKLDGSLRIETPNFKMTVYALAGDYELNKQEAIAVVQALRGVNTRAAALALDSQLGVRLGGNTVCG